jgi:hypothetical protein
MANDLGNLLTSAANGHGALAMSAPNIPSTTSLGGGNTIGGMPLGMTSGRGAPPGGPLAGQSQDLFSYTPANATVVVGQPIELRPALTTSNQQYVFAVAPDLPRGLIIDRRTGVIHGFAQEATSAGNTTYFVTLFEPLSAKVKVAIVQLNILEIMAPGKHITNLVHHNGATTVTLYDAPVAPVTPPLPHMASTASREPQFQAALVSQVQDQLLHTIAALHAACAAQNPRP